MLVVHVAAEVGAQEESLKMDAVFLMLPLPVHTKLALSNPKPIPGQNRKHHEKPVGREDKYNSVFASTRVDIGDRERDRK